MLKESGVPSIGSKIDPSASGGIAGAVVCSAQTLRLARIRTEDDPTTFVELAFAEGQLDEEIGKLGTQPAIQKGNS